MKLNLGTANAHFEDCNFSGRWEGNFDARPDTGDPAKRVVIRGNDFTGCREFGLQGGVDRTANTFDPSLQLVLWRGNPNWEHIRSIAEQDGFLRNVVCSIEGHGPFDLGQDWMVLNREIVADDVWTRLRQVRELTQKGPTTCPIVGRSGTRGPKGSFALTALEAADL